MLTTIRQTDGRYSLFSTSLGELVLINLSATGLKVLVAKGHATSTPVPASLRARSSRIENRPRRAV
jgi:hypothetical protein